MLKHLYASAHSAQEGGNERVNICCMQRSPYGKECEKSFQQRRGGNRKKHDNDKAFSKQPLDLCVQNENLLTNNGRKERPAVRVGKTKYEKLQHN